MSTSTKTTTNSTKTLSMQERLKLWEEKNGRKVPEEFKSQLEAKTLARKEVLRKNKGEDTSDEDDKQPITITKNVGGTGVIVPAMVLEHKVTVYSKGENPADAKKKHEYTVMIYGDFTDVTVPPNFGTKINKHQIDLTVRSNVDFTSEELEQGANKCSIISGNKYKITWWGEPLLGKSTEDIVGTNVLLCRLSAKKKDQYQMTLAVERMMENPDLDEPEKVYKAARTLSLTNAIPDISPNSGYGDENVSKTEREKEMEEDKKGKNMSKVQLWVRASRRAHPNERERFNRYLVADISGKHKNNSEAELFDADLYSISTKDEFKLSDPIWLDQQEFRFTHTSKEKGETEKKKAIVLYEAAKSTMQNGKIKVLKSKVQVKLSDEILDNLGITDPVRFAAVARYYLPYCKAWVVGKYDLLASLDMEENSAILNKDRKTGFDYGGMYNVQALFFSDPVAGIVEGGYEVNASCATEILKKILSDGTTRSSRNTRSKSNPLNKVPEMPVINLVESMATVEGLAKTDYRFFVVGGSMSKESRDMQEWLEEMKENSPDKWIDTLSEVILGKGGKAYRGFPVSISKPEELCLFAIRNSTLITYNNFKLNEELESESVDLQAQFEQCIEAVENQYNEKRKLAELVKTEDKESPKTKRRKTEDSNENEPSEMEDEHSLHDTDEVQDGEEEEDEEGMYDPMNDIDVR